MPCMPTCSNKCEGHGDHEDKFTENDMSDLVNDVVEEATAITDDVMDVVED